MNAQYPSHLLLCSQFTDWGKLYLHWDVQTGINEIEIANCSNEGPHSTTPSCVTPCYFFISVCNLLDVCVTNHHQHMCFHLIQFLCFHFGSFFIYRDFFDKTRHKRPKQSWKCLYIYCTNKLEHHHLPTSLWHQFKIIRELSYLRRFRGILPASSTFFKESMNHRG